MSKIFDIYYIYIHIYIDKIHAKFFIVFNEEKNLTNSKIFHKDLCFCCIYFVCINPIWICINFAFNSNLVNPEVQSYLC